MISFRAQRSGARNQRSGNLNRKIDILINYDYPVSLKLRMTGGQEHGQEHDYDYEHEHEHEHT
jgi:hypothetical protein